VFARGRCAARDAARIDDVIDPVRVSAVDRPTTDPHASMTAA
jgi:hypothetical protein